MKTVDSSEQKVVFGKAIFLTMLKQTVKVDSNDLSGRGVGHSHQYSAVLVLSRLQKLQQVVLMLLKNATKQILDLGDLKDGEPDFLASPGLRVKRANGDLISCDIVVHRNFDDVDGTALDVNHDRKVRAS